MLKEGGFGGTIAATTRYPDEAGELREAGVGAVYDFYAEAGSGFADHVCDTVEE
jgi:glutathione-regulated potassium-efflux system ancillary protein KefC